MDKALILPPERFIGGHALEQALPAICKCGAKALLVTGSSMLKQGHAETLRKSLLQNGVGSAAYSGVTGEPTDKMVEDGIAIYLENHCDFIIGFGGGSQIDCAKAISAMVSHPGKISDYIGKPFENQGPPLVAIPSTAGTGSEATQVTIITDTVQNVKMLLKGASLLPKIAVVDPVYTFQVPPNVTAWTGLDALTHAVEAYASRHAFPACDTYALSAVRRIFTNLPKAYIDGADQNARKEMSIAAYEAGVTICNSTVTLVHGMSRPIGALFHVPHGLSNAMLLNACLTFAADGAADRFADLARAIGAAQKSDDDLIAAKCFIEAVDRLCRTLNIPTLSEYGIDQTELEAAIPKMAKDAEASGSPANTRKAVTVTDIENIYRRLR